MQDFRVFKQVYGVLHYVGTITAPTEADALRIAKQKWRFAPIIKRSGK